ncbi:MAG: insulinase family protein, partial [Firmicutes bacterium]|nr:insulinase family protein [Bacillota bacterium]
MLDSFIYKNGLRVILDKNTNVKTVCVGFWIGSGSAREDEGQNGIAHFVEHMMFKGTPKMSPFDIADRFERVGAQVNAFTGKEYTCYYFKSVDDSCEECFETLADIFFDSDYKQVELDKERNVVIEEIGMTEDSSEDLCFDLSAKIGFDNTSLGNTILGPVSNVARFQKTDILGYTQKNYLPGNMVVAVSGNIDFKTVDKMVRKYVMDRFASALPKSAVTQTQTLAKPQTAKLIKDFEQSNVLLSYPSIAFNDEKMYAQSILNAILGGGMSSRLFQKVREEHGLCYSIYTAPLYYNDLGSFNIVCNMSAQNTKQVLDLMLQEIEKLCKEGIRQAEFERAKAQLKATFVYSQESTQSCMSTI